MRLLTSYKCLLSFQDKINIVNVIYQLQAIFNGQQRLFPAQSGSVSIDISADGAVVAVRVLSDLGHGTGPACADAWRKAKFSPGKQDGVPVAVTGIPQVCTVRIEQ